LNKVLVIRIVPGHYKSRDVAAKNKAASSEVDKLQLLLSLYTPTSFAGPLLFPYNEVLKAILD
jgi:hypothetical protein